MTKDEIFSMALSVVPENDRKEAQNGDILMLTHEELERFAALVAEKATEQANARQNASWALMCKKMVAAEREKCAQVCEDDASTPEERICAAAIRARGQK